MLSYAISKKKIKGSIDYFEFDSDGYVYYPNINFIGESGVVIRNKYLTDIILFNFDHSFDKITKSIYMYTTSDEETDEGINIFLNEISRLRSIVELEFKKHLSIEKYKEYLNKLYYLDTELKRKQTILRYSNELDFEMHKGRSR